jgi:hypothetical protein
VSSCICPDDYVGNNCEKDRYVSCSASLVSPIPNCDHPIRKGNENNEQQNCLIFDPQHPNVTLRFNLQCAFLNSSDINQTLNSLYNFSYVIDNGKVELITICIWLTFLQFRSTKGVIWVLQLKIYNFNALSDPGATFFLDLSTQSLNGTEDIFFNFSLADIPERYWQGNRLYIEMGTSVNNVAPTNYISRLASR